MFRLWCFRGLWQLWLLGMPDVLSEEDLRMFCSSLLSRDSSAAKFVRGVDRFTPEIDHGNLLSDLTGRDLFVCPRNLSYLTVYFWERGSEGGGGWRRVEEGGGGWRRVEEGGGRWRRVEAGGGGWGRVGAGGKNERLATLCMSE